MEMSASQQEQARKPDDEEESRASAALERAAQAVEQAAASLARSAEASASEPAHLGQVAGVLEHAVVQIEEAQQEAGEGGASADAIAGLRSEVTRMHEQMVESVMATREVHPGEPAAPAASRASNEGEESRSGYSALLHRYQAPRFSLDELAPELRSFDSEAAIERARRAGVAPDGSFVAQTDDPPAGGSPSRPGSEPHPEPEPELRAWEPEEASTLLDADPEAELERDADEEAPRDDDAVEEQRLRLAQFLRRR
jgi:hypothetical protein